MVKTVNTDTSATFLHSDSAVMPQQMVNKKAAVKERCGGTIKRRDLRPRSDKLLKTVAMCDASRNLASTCAFSDFESRGVDVTLCPLHPCRQLAPLHGLEVTRHRIECRNPCHYRSCGVADREVNEWGDPAAVNDPVCWGGRISLDPSELSIQPIGGHILSRSYNLPGRRYCSRVTGLQPLRGDTSLIMSSTYECSLSLAVQISAARLSLESFACHLQAHDIMVLTAVRVFHKDLCSCSTICSKKARSDV